MAQSIAPYWVERLTPSEWRLDLHRQLDQLVRVAFALLLFHEVYHHQMEVFALSAPFDRYRDRDPADGAVLYAAYKDAVYRPTWGTDLNLEEALAVAASFRCSLDPVAALRSFGFPVGPELESLPFEPARRWLIERVPHHLAGYRNGIRLLADDTFRAVERALTMEWADAESILLIRELSRLRPLLAQGVDDDHLCTVEQALEQEAWVDVRHRGRWALHRFVRALEREHAQLDLSRHINDLIHSNLLYPSGSRRWFDATPSGAAPLADLAERVFLVD